MKVDTVLFDLDDTLYDEMAFVMAALADVSKFLAERTREPAELFLADLLETLDSQGRGHVFDSVLEQRGLPSGWVPTMLSIYRCAAPELDLYSDARALLLSLRSRRIRVGLVTDGCALVQANKVSGLGLDSLADAVVYTDVVGPLAQKPSTKGFLVALELLRSDPQTSAYVANDVRKDFIGPRKLGMIGLLVSRKKQGDLREQPRAAQPHYVLDDLSEVEETLALTSSSPSN